MAMKRQWNGAKNAVSAVYIYILKWPKFSSKKFIITYISGNRKRAFFCKKSFYLLVSRQFYLIIVSFFFALEYESKKKFN